MIFENKNKDRPSIIRHTFSDELLKKLYFHATRPDLYDNNQKAELILDLLGPSFEEVGTGTNRVGVLKNGIIYKIAIDRRGLVDNLTELKRAGEKPYFVKVYECNYIIVACEFWTVMDEEIFLQNEKGIKTILEDLSKDYIFNDLGFNVKNCYNWGYREIVNEDGKSDGEIGILDFGYVFPKVGQYNALRCPKCGAEVKYNSAFTLMKCSNSDCGTEYSLNDIYGRMNKDFDEWETAQHTKMKHTPVPYLTYNGTHKTRKQILLERGSKI